MPYYEFPDNEYYALIQADNEEKATVIYKKHVGEDDSAPIKPVSIHPNLAKKQYEDVVVDSEDYQAEFDAFEKMGPNQVLLIDGLLVN
ncbi:hypothetical protein ACRW9N_10810 [Listeria aquatica]|uniref:hypothetical protein n=1 Tax=Listeria aquatica TaxID=1494960 RepID=UPI003EF41FBC